MDGNFYDIVRLLKNGQKSDSFAAHFRKNFDSNMSGTNLCKYITFKLVYQLNPIGTMKNVQNLTASYVWRNV